MSENKRKKIQETYLKSKTWQKILGLPVVIILFLLWVLDRYIHIFLPHVTHKKWSAWLLDPSSLKLTLARVVIFSIPFILYKLIF